MMAGYIHGATFDRVVPCGPSRTARDHYRSSSKSAKRSPTKDGAADRQREVLRRFAIVGSYVGVWVCFYLLVHASGGDTSKATQNSAMLVLLVEVIKIIASAGLFVLWHGFDQLLVFLGSPVARSWIALRVLRARCAALRYLQQSDVFKPEGEQSYYVSDILQF